MATIAGYGLDEPTGAELEASLRALLGPSKAKHLVASTLDAIGEAGDSLEGRRGPALWTFCSHAARHRGLVAIIVRSFTIRLRAYESLTALPPPDTVLVRGASHD